MKSTKLLAFCLCMAIPLSTAACGSSKSASSTLSSSSVSSTLSSSSAVVTGSGSGTPLPSTQVIKDKWVEKASMSTPRFHGGSAVIDGKLYMFGGGTTDDHHNTDSAEVYDPASNEWHDIKSMPNGLYVEQSAVLNGKIYALGRYQTDKSTSAITLERYDPATDTWTELAPMGTAPYLFSLAVLDGEIYVIGGQDNNNKEKPLSTVEAYDAASNTWVKKASMHTPRTYFKTEVVDGKLYAIGNAADGDFDSSDPMEMYDPKTNQWTEKATLSVRRIDFQTVAADGKIYAIAGSAPGSNGGSIDRLYTSMEEYDPVTDKWTTKAPMIDKDEIFQTAVLNGKIYIIGGYNDIKYGDQAANFLSSVQEYDPQTNKWAEKSPLKIGRRDIKTAVIGDSIYAIGGTIGPDASDKGTNLVEAYTATK